MIGVSQGLVVVRGWVVGVPHVKKMCPLVQKHDEGLSAGRITVLAYWARVQDYNNVHGIGLVYWSLFCQLHLPQPEKDLLPLLFTDVYGSKDQAEHKQNSSRSIPEFIVQCGLKVDW